jgi:hypothetical protein
MPIDCLLFLKKSKKKRTGNKLEKVSVDEKRFSIVLVLGQI